MQISDNKVEIIRRHNKVVYRDGDRIVKVFVHSKPAADVFREALNLARVASSGLNTPQVLEVSQVEDGSWALSTAYNPGENLQKLMDDAAGTPAFDELLEKFVDLQIKVHNTPAPPALNPQRDKIIRMIGRVKSLDPSARYDLQMRADRMRNGRSICHGDFNPSNVIVNDEGKEFILDWTHVTEGLPEADAAMTYILFSMENTEVAEKYLTLFSKKSDTPKQKILYWVPVVAAAELSRGRKEREEFLRKLIDVATDYE